MEWLFLLCIWFVLCIGSWANAQEPTAASSAFTSQDPVVLESLRLVNSGEFKAAEVLLTHNDAAADPDATRARLETLEIIRRMRIEYSLDAQGLLGRVRQTIPDASEQEVELWAKESLARFKVIDGKRFFTRREPQNIFLFSRDAIDRRTAAGNSPPPTAWQLKDHLAKIVSEAERSDSPEVLPVKHRFSHAITIRGNHPKIKVGSVVRVWMPFAQEYRQQREVKLIHASPEPKMMAPSGVEGNPVTSGAQRTVYFEHVVVDRTKPLIFQQVFEYNSYAYYPKLDPVRALPLPSDWNQAYLNERLPHIDFTPEIRNEVNAIIGSETNPMIRAQKIFHWVSTNIPWTAEDEYSIIPSFTLRAFNSRRGDCGVQNTLFVTMCRIAGIPARWQSGFETMPGQWGNHDWAEIYIAPWGWLPVDASYGIQKSEDPRIEYFYFGHQDSYRLIVNLDWGRELYPPKQSLRSEPADLQRGEVEVDGQNLYFDEWVTRTVVNHRSP
jgi:hypothetical protein